jgi:hydrogenase nickel incorporation protein HypA/HybF
MSHRLKRRHYEHRTRGAGALNERSLIADIMSRVLELAERAGALKVTVVRVRLGALSQASPERLQERWQHMTRGTVADGSRLEITRSDDPGAPHAAGIALGGVDAELPD